jgi:23S rRNA (pseudouridine1915-N3)-methyltransferase
VPALKLNIAAVGKLKEDYWKAACTEYLKRLMPYVQARVVEVDDVDPQKAGGEARARTAEATQLRRALASATPLERAHTVALDSKGKQLTSEQLAQLLRQVSNDTSTLVFYIGGPTGLETQLLQEADTRFSLGLITLPHNLARVVLLEQLYRACKINHGEPYHK